MNHVQQRDGRWCIVDLYGKHGRVRTVPMPTWVKVAIDAWTGPAGVVDGFVFRPVIRGDQVRGDVLSEKVFWQMLRPYAKAAGVAGIAPHDCRRTAAKLCRAAGGELEQIQLLLGHASIQTTERYLGTKQDLVHAPVSETQILQELRDNSPLRWARSAVRLAPRSPNAVDIATTQRGRATAPSPPCCPAAPSAGPGWRRSELSLIFQQNRRHYTDPPAHSRAVRRPSPPA